MDLELIPGTDRDGSQENVAKRVCAESARWRRGAGSAGAPLPGGWRGPALGTGAPSAAVCQQQQQQRRQRAVIHRFPAADIYYSASLRGRHEMWSREGINTERSERGAAASPVQPDGFPHPPPPAALSGWWILMEENKGSQKSLSLSAGLSPFALCFGSSAAVGWDVAGMGARREGGRDGRKGLPWEAWPQQGDGTELGPSS